MIEPTQLPTPLPEEDDDALIRRVADGDDRAFEALYERYAPRLRGYLRAQLGQPDLADDACHEVLLIVWTTAERFQHASQLSTWIYGIAWRVANRMRTKAHPPHWQPEHNQNHLAAGLNPANELERHERQRALARGLQTLPHLLRQTVELRYQRQYRSQQIADEMHCSITQVNHRLHQARRRLAAVLRRQESPLALTM